MKINIKTVQHNEQIYSTCGDWKWTHVARNEGDETVLDITVSSTGNENYNALIAIHEMVEALLCKHNSITGEAVTTWDEKFEKARAEYPEIFGDREPGDHPGAPYHEQHLFASRLEQSLALELGVDWQEYNRVVNGL